MERHFNGDGSEVYKDMKIHKKFPYQTKPLIVAEVASVKDLISFMLLSLKGS